MPIEDVYCKHKTTIYFRDDPDITWEANEIMNDQQIENEIMVEEEKRETLCWALLELESSRQN